MDYCGKLMRIGNGDLTVFSRNNIIEIVRKTRR